MKVAVSLHADLRYCFACCLAGLITCHKYSAVSDCCAYAHLSSFSWYVLIYCTARSHYSVVNATLPSLDCISAFQNALGIFLIGEGCIHADLCYRFACCLKCHKYLALSDICAYAYLMSVRWYVLIYRWPLLQALIVFEHRICDCCG